MINDSPIDNQDMEPVSEEMLNLLGMSEVQKIARIPRRFFAERMALAHQAKNTSILQIDRGESQKHCCAKLHPSLESTDLDIWHPFNGTKEHRAHGVTCMVICSTCHQF